MPPTKFKIPSTEEEWHRAVANTNLQNTTLHDVDLLSGSRANKAQFLLMRILCELHGPTEFDPVQWGLDRFKDAEAMLRNTPEFQVYLQSILDDAPTTLRSPNDPLPLEIFEIPRCHQRYVQQLGKRTSIKLSAASSGRKEAWKIVPMSDELVVTFAAVDFLQAVCLKNPGVYTQWVASCYSFEALGEEGYEARTDGVLHLDAEPERVYALLECKSVKRTDALPQVQYQEAAQIAAWICQENHPETAKLGHLTLGTLDRHYRNFLQKKAHASRFLTLHQYGPFMVNKADHMEILACIVLAFVLGVGKGR